MLGEPARAQFCLREPGSRGSPIATATSQGYAELGKLALGLTVQECNHEDCSAGPTARMLIAASQAKILPKFPSATLSFQYSFYNVLIATLTLFLMPRFYG